MSMELIKSPEDAKIVLSSEEFRGDLEALLRPKGLTFERFVICAVNAVRAAPELAKADRLSFVDSVRVAAELGLEPNGPLGHGWILPYRDHGQVRAQFIPGYRGFISLAYRSGKVSRLFAKCVYKDDEFDYQEGLNPVLVHRPAINGDRGNGSLTCAYAVAKLQGTGEPMIDVMSRDEIDQIMSASKSARSSYSPWKGPYVSEMIRKCPLRRLSKYLPLDNPGWSRLLEVDNADYQLNQKQPDELHFDNLPRPQSDGKSWSENVYAASELEEKKKAQPRGFKAGNGKKPEADLLREQILHLSQEINDAGGKSNVIAEDLAEVSVADLRGEKKRMEAALSNLRTQEEETPF